ncbi:MAG: Gfo/Idh/MocA family oxidoreductase [Cytophagales bacterium]|nr:Gfo/Idh/MocA family oxidoreductase [Cytophagales bacterium]
MINFGILGTSDLTRRSLIGASEEVPEVNVLAIASRDLNRAAAYAESQDIPECFGDYDQIIKHPDIQAVYVPLVPSLHAEWVIKAIQAEKHVLVEKPICLSSVETAQIQAALNEHSVVVMEAMMSQFHSWQTDLMEILNKKPYGELLSLETTSQYILPEEDHTYRTHKSLGGGVFREEGNVWLQLVQLCFGLDFSNQQVEADFKAGVDMNFRCELEFENGRYARITCAYDQPYKAIHKLQFEDTTITVQNFWRPTFGANKVRLNFTSKEVSRKHIYAPENYYVNQLRHFVLLLKRKEQENQDLEAAFQRVKITEALYDSVVTEPTH